MNTFSWTIIQISERLTRCEGYKFETLSLIPDQWALTSREDIEKRDDIVVNNYAQYCSVVKTGFGKVKMVIGGEVDASTSQPSNIVVLSNFFPRSH